MCSLAGSNSHQNAISVLNEVRFLLVHLHTAGASIEITPLLDCTASHECSSLSNRYSLAKGVHRPLAAILFMAAVASSAKVVDTCTDWGFLACVAAGEVASVRTDAVDRAVAGRTEVAFRKLLLEACRTDLPVALEEAFRRDRWEEVVLHTSQVVVSHVAAEVGLQVLPSVVEPYERVVKLEVAELHTLAVSPSYSFLFDWHSSS